MRSTPSRPSRAVVTTAGSIAVGEPCEHASFPQRELAQPEVARRPHQPVAARADMLGDVPDAVDRHAFDHRAGLARRRERFAHAGSGEEVVDRADRPCSPAQASGSSGMSTAASGVGVVPPPAHDRGLTRGPEQGAVLGPQVHEPVPEAVGDRVHTDVGEHPLGRHAVRDPQRVVETVPAGAPSERLADPRRHEVADDRECGGRHVEQLGQAHPDRRRSRCPADRAGPRRAARPPSVPRAGSGSCRPSRCGARAAGTRRARARRAAPPTARRPPTAARRAHRAP